MEKKPFRPQIVDPTAESLCAVYGITEQRREALLSRVAMVLVVAGDGKTHWFQVLDQLAAAAETPGEFAYLTVITTAYSIDNYIPNLL
jgi:hypothetical protein